MCNSGSIEKRGIGLLREHLEAAGRVVTPSPDKTFDLVVDGRLAEVKCKNAPYRQMDFIGLTENQYRALKDGVNFLMFLVCGVGDPASVEIFEFESARLLRSEPKVECTYYWYRTALNDVVGELDR